MKINKWNPVSACVRRRDSHRKKPSEISYNIFCEDSEGVLLDVTDEKQAQNFLSNEKSKSTNYRVNLARSSITQVFH